MEYDATCLPGLHGQEQATAAYDGDDTGLVEPIDLASAKRHLRVVITDDDDYIAALIIAARVTAEQRLNRTLVRRTMSASFSHWGDMVLPKPPLISVESVEYIDPDGNTLSLQTYDVYRHTTPARVAVSAGETVPHTHGRPDAVTVHYTAGYPDGQVPAPIIQWMLLVIGTLYDHRATMAAGVQTYNIPDDFMQMLIWPYMVFE